MGDVLSNLCLLSTHFRVRRGNGDAICGLEKVFFAGSCAKVQVNRSGVYREEVEDHDPERPA